MEIKYKCIEKGRNQNLKDMVFLCAGYQENNLRNLLVEKRFQSKVVSIGLLVPSDVCFLIFKKRLVVQKHLQFFLAITYDGYNTNLNPGELIIAYRGSVPPEVCKRTFNNEINLHCLKLQLHLSFDG